MSLTGSEKGVNRDRQNIENEKSKYCGKEINENYKEPQ